MTTIFRRTPRQRRAAKARAQVAQRLAATDSVAERIVAERTAQWGIPHEETASVPVNTETTPVGLTVDTQSFPLGAIDVRESRP